MGGVEGNDAPTTLSRSKAGTIVKFLSLALALTLLFVSLYSMNIVTSVQSNEAGWSNMSLALAQDQTFNYTLNLTQKEGSMISDASASGILLADPDFAGSINEWVEYYPRLEIEINQTYSLEFNHTYLNITLHDSKGNVVSSAIWGVDSEIGSSSGWIGAVINHPDNYRLELKNLGPDWFYANIGVYISGQYLQKPLFYYGLAGLIMTSSYLVVFFVVGVWTKKRERTPLQSLERCLVKKSRCVLCDIHALCAIRAVQL
jgi:hypothetical protein